MPPPPRASTARTALLEVAYLQYGSADGWPVLLLHGFPYDVRAYDEVAPALADAGARVVVPYLRGFGPTRFLAADTMRSGQQAALGGDVVALLDALGIERAILAGFDWGGLSACVATALRPERVAGLVSYASYDVIDIDRQRHPAAPALEHVMWYQHLFQTERGREGLAMHRRALCRLLWEQWSPGWMLDEARFEAAAAAFENPDFVEVVIHAYRFCFGAAAGDPGLAAHEARLAGRPAITVPTVTLDGSRDPLKPGGTADHAALFTARHEHRVIDAGHALPYEAPGDFADAVLTVRGWVDEAGYRGRRR